MQGSLSIEKSDQLSLGSLRERAYAFIQRKIMAGDLPTGAPLSEIALSKEIGISRTPVREAIGQLLTEGFLEQVHGRGTLVRRPNRADLVELYELREALEVYAVGKAAQHGVSPDAAEALQRSCARLQALTNELAESGRQKLDSNQMERLLGIDLHFHNLLLRATANHRIVKVTRDTRMLIQILSMLHETHDFPQLTAIHGFHQGIVQAVLGGDEPAAVRLMTDHIRLSKQERLDEFDRWDRMTRMDQGDHWLDYYRVQDET
jgi:DNA-binding GntR family transcriptional regulator